VADALEYAAGQGVLHRDVKPSNLLLDVWSTVWLTDFGLAKATGTPDLTRTGDLLGTLRYVAPERFRGRPTPAATKKRSAWDDSSVPGDKHSQRPWRRPRRVRRHPCSTRLLIRAGRAKPDSAGAFFHTFFGTSCALLLSRGLHAKAFPA
jgi:serine/threonine protein kinase